MSFDIHKHPKKSCSFYASSFILLSKNTLSTLHISLCTKANPLWEKNKQKSEPADGIVALQKAFQKIPLKHASLSTMFNHLLLNQCSIFLLLNATHEQLNKQNHTMQLHWHTSPETNLLCSGSQIQLALNATVYNPRLEKLILIR